MIKIALNRKVPSNYAFFCPVSKLHLTLSNPVGYIDRITNNVLVGLRKKTLIDVNNVIDITTGSIKNEVVNDVSSLVETDNKVKATKAKKAQQTKQSQTNTNINQ